MKRVLLVLGILCGNILCEARHSQSNPWRWRFAYNYCTLSYSFAFHNQKDWAREIHWLATRGFNAVPVQAGLAKVWQLTLKDLGANDRQIASFLPDAAARAWWCMGNLEGLGGPLSQADINRDAQLGNDLVKMLGNKGITPVFQGFTGLVPHDFAEYGAANARVIGQGHWQGFMRPAILDPTSPRFAEVAKIWYRNLKKVYGVKPTAFAGDLFHEGGNTGGLDVTASARAVQREMILAGGRQAVWFIQSWQGTPSEALLAGLTDQNTVILLLVKDMSPGGSDPKNLRHFGTKPWLWCEVSNFGGKSGLYGGFLMLCDFARVVQSPQGKHLVGMGMLSEGVGLNPLWYDFFAYVMGKGPAVTFIPRAEIERFVAAYAERRYKMDSPLLREALMLLVDSVYSPPSLQEGPSENILCAKPAWDITHASSWGTTRRYWDAEKIRRAAHLFDEARSRANAKSRDSVYGQNLIFDSVDIQRQVLQDELAELLKKAKTSAKARQQFLNTIRRTDSLLSSVPKFTYDYWQGKARTSHFSHAEDALKRMVTDWSGRADSLDDYSQRQWSGLITGYYLPRWKKFFDDEPLAP